MTGDLPPSSSDTSAKLFAELCRMCCAAIGPPVKEMRAVRGKQVSMIFQEPMTSLNPVQTVGSQVVEAIRLHERVSMAAARARVVELFEINQETFKVFLDLVSQNGVHCFSTQ